MKPIVLSLLLLTGARSCTAGTGAFGAPLGNGAVGYRVEWTADPSRSWQVPDPSGRIHAVPRMVRVHTWYPAVSGTGKPMTFADYFRPKAASGVPPQVIQLVRANDVGDTSYSFRGIYRSDSAAYARALRTRVAAGFGARPAAGRFPVIVYSVGQNDFTQDAVSIAEFLASNGFVVTTVPHLGTGPRRPLLFVHDPLSYETQLRDLELALGRALASGSADPHRVLAIGHSYGGIYALLLAERSSLVRGVIGLDPTYIAKRAGFEYDLRHFPYFDPDLRVPIVTLRRDSDVDRSLLDGFQRAERLEIVYPQLQHGDFTTVAFLRRDLPAELQRADEVGLRSPRLAAAGAAAAFDQVLACANQILSGRELHANADNAEGVRASASHAPASRAPTHEELYWICRSHGLQAAEDSLRRATTGAAPSGIFAEPRLLTISRELGYLNRRGESLDMFRLTAFAFPDSVSAQLAAATALLDAGLKDEARALLTRAQQLEPDNPAVREALAKTATM